MLNPLNFFSKLIKSNNQRELDRIAKIVNKINSLEEEIKNLKDEDFPKKTIEFKEKIRKGDSSFALLEPKTQNQRVNNVSLLSKVNKTYFWYQSYSCATL